MSLTKGAETKGAQREAGMWGKQRFPALLASSRRRQGWGQDHRKMESTPLSPGIESSGTGTMLRYRKIKTVLFSTNQFWN